MKNVFRLKVVLTFVCAFSILFGTVLVNGIIPHASALSIEDLNTETKIVTFDDMPDYYKTNNETLVTAEDGSISVVEGAGINGSKAMKRKLVDPKNGKNKYQALNDGQNALKVENATTYLAKINYFVENPSDVLTIDIRAALRGNFYYNPTPLVSEQLHVSTAGKWLTKTMLFTTPAAFKTGTGGEHCNSLYIGIHDNGNSIIYVDNIALTKLYQTSDNYSAVFVDYGYENRTELFVGNPGDSVQIPTPHRGDDAKFLGWYANEIRSKATALPGVIGSSIQKIYADWYVAEPVTVDFENVPAELSANTSTTLVTPDDGSFSIVDGIGVNGSKALKREKATQTYELMQAMNDGEGYLVLKSNTTYRVSFDYYIASGSGQTFAAMSTARAGNMFYNRKYWVQNLGLEVQNGTWYKQEAIFTTGDLDINNCAYFGLSGNKDTVVYLDNIQFFALAPDDILLEYKASDLGFTKRLIGKAGEPIQNPPVLDSKYYTFEGWFTDEQYQNPYISSVFPNEKTTLYAKITWNEVLSVNFEDFPFEQAQNGQFSGEVMEIAQGPSSDGDGYALRFDNSRPDQNRHARPFMLYVDDAALRIQDGEKYLITFDYYFENATNGEFSIQFATGDPANMWNKSVKFTNDIRFIDSHYEHKKWLTTSAIGTTAVNSDMNALTCYIQIPFSSVMLMDNIRVRKLEANESAVVYHSDSTTVPEPTIVKNGTNVKLPELTSLPKGKAFSGWYLANEAYKSDEIPVNEDVILVAKTVTTSVEEGFEATDYLFRGINGYGLDHDIQIYDSKASGHSDKNVKSGQFSLHRIGAEPAFKSYSLHSNGYLSMYTLEEFKTYTVTLNVKVENPVHNLGAISMRSLLSANDPWGFSGYEMFIAPIKDISDGNWHEISYTFVSTSPYLSLITPGNLSVYIDDIRITEAAEGAQLSEDCAYEEYIPKMLNAEGKYMIGEDEDISSEFTPIMPQPEPEEIPERDDGDGNPMTGDIKIAAVIIIGGLLAAVLVLVRKRNRKGSLNV